jgi:hypothetical protein
MRLYPHTLTPILCAAFVAPVFAQQPATIQPIVSEVALSSEGVTDVHLRPLFTTTIRLPDAVSSVAIGAPTLFEAEHSDGEPRLVYVKPSTKDPAESNLVITMRSGGTISLRLISQGADAGNVPVDFIVDYKPQQSLFAGSTDRAIEPNDPVPPGKNERDSPLDRAFKCQSDVATPTWQHGSASDKKEKNGQPPAMLGALGEITEQQGAMIVAYSVLNQSDHWIEVLPPQVQVSSPGDKDQQKKKEKKHIVLAEQVAVDRYRLDTRKLPPGARADGAVEFTRPSFKQSQEKLLLQLASANSVDKPLLLPLPFVGPNNSPDHPKAGDQYAAPESSSRP